VTRDEQTVALLSRWENTAAQLDAERATLPPDTPVARALLDAHSATLVSCANELRALWQGSWQNGHIKERVR